jgi:hypothetical protein
MAGRGDEMYNEGARLTAQGLELIPRLSLMSGAFGTILLVFYPHFAKWMEDTGTAEWMRRYLPYAWGEQEKFTSPLSVLNSRIVGGVALVLGLLLGGWYAAQPFIR